MLRSINFNANSQSLHDFTHPYGKSQKIDLSSFFERK
jgi:hypothetical protein